MAHYVDGFVVPVLQYWECVGDDMKTSVAAE